jgi:hypothetical protein
MSHTMLALGLAALVGFAGCLAAPEPRLAPRPTEPLRLPPSVAEQRVVPDEGSCAPPGHPDSAFTACCTGRACAGYCLLNTRTQIVSCDCFGRAGGCSEGTICCKATGGCTTPEKCVSRKTPER